MKKEFNQIKNWDFKTRIDGYNNIYITPIPMSYSGKMMLKDLEIISKCVDDGVKLLFSGDGCVIYCFDRYVAEQLLKNGHNLMIEHSKEIGIH